MKNKKSPLLFLATLALSVPAAHGVDKFWEGNTSATWNSTANWSLNNTVSTSTVAIPTISDDVFFHITGTLGGSGAAMSLAGNQAANSITFRQSQNFSIASNTSTGSGSKTLTLGTGGISKTSASGSVTINGNQGTGGVGTGIITVTLGSATSQTWTNNSTTTALNVGTGFISGTSTAAIISLGAFAGANANTLTLAGGGNFNFGAATTTNAVITGTTGSLIKSGAGTVTIGGVNTYGGTTTISGGKLALTGTGSIANTPTIIVGASTTFDVSAVTGGYTLGSSQTVGGSGTILATGKNVVANGTLSPGNSPGTLTQDGGTLQLGVGGDYNWQIHDATGAAGTGYDTTNLINGASLDLSLLSTGNTYNINLWSLSGLGPDVNGNAINFDNTLNYSWTLFSTGSAISEFSTDKFTINAGAFNGTSGFSNALGGGAFSVGLGDGNTDLVLNFTAIPEPSAALLGGLGMLALLRRRR